MHWRAIPVDKLRLSKTKTFFIFFDTARALLKADDISLDREIWITESYSFRSLVKYLNRPELLETKLEAVNKDPEL